MSLASTNFEFDESRTTLVKCPQDISGSVIVPAGVQTIGANAFLECKELTEVTLPSSLTKVSSGAFSKCEKLEKINFNGTLEAWLNLNWNFSFGRGYSLYIDNEKVTDIVIPSSVTVIKSNAFYYCQSLQSVTFHDGITKIDASAFNKTGLNKSIVLPANLEELGNYAFFNSNIKGVKFTSDIQKIGKGAFAACYSLFTINLEKENEHFGCDQKRFLYEKTSKGDTLIAVAYNFFTSRLCTIPEHIAGIGDECFCFNCIPSKNGLAINHDLTFVASDAFRSAKGKIKVPVGRLPQALQIGLPKSLLEEYFCFDYAFVTNKKHVEAVVNNPFRILGVDASANARTITANATKIKRFNDVGKTLDFPIDHNEELPKVNRSSENVDWALAQINLPKDKLRYALFWFGDANSALAEEEDIEINSWRDYLNQAAKAILNKDLGEAVSLITELINESSEFSSFVSDVAGENFEIDEDELAHLYIETMLESVNIPSCRLLFKDHGKVISDDEYLDDKVYGLYEQRIKAQIQTAEKVDDSNTEACLNAAQQLKNNAGLILNDFKSVIGNEDDTRYSMLADELAECILQRSIDYYNNSLERRAALNTLELVQYTISIAVGQKQIDRCEEQKASSSTRTSIAEAL